MNLGIRSHIDALTVLAIIRLVILA